MDVQGYEYPVLQGAEKIITSKNLKGILMEMSFEKLYKNQKTFDFLYKEMIKRGFRIWNMTNIFVEKDTGKLLQADVLFFK